MLQTINNVDIRWTSLSDHLYSGSVAIGMVEIKGHTMNISTVVDQSCA